VSLTTHVTVCVCHAELKGYLLTYLITNQAAKRLGGGTSRGEITRSETSIVQRRRWASKCYQFCGQRVAGFYSAMLRRARYCYGKSSVCLSVTFVVSWSHWLETFKN